MSNFVLVLEHGTEAGVIATPRMSCAAWVT